MIDEVILSEQLQANFVSVTETKEFMLEVLTEYLNGSYAPLQNGRIDGKRVAQHLECMLEGAIKEKNPDFDCSIVISIEWGMRQTPICGFFCRILVGVKDFDTKQYGHSAVDLAPLWQ